MTDEATQRPEDYYEVLQVSQVAGVEVIQAAYERLVDRWHADRKPGDHSAFQQILILDEAHAVLSDPGKRREYDSRRKPDEVKKGAKQEPAPVSRSHRSTVMWAAAIGACALAFVVGNRLLSSAVAPPNRDRDSGVPIGSPLSADALFTRASPAVVQVVIQDRRFRTIGGGSGFLVGSSGLIVTNYHVIEKAHAAHILFADKTKVEVFAVAAFDEAADIAIIRIESPPSIQPLELGVNGLPAVGAKVYAIGNPLGLANTLSDGLVSGQREFDGMTAIQTTAPISPGSSGGPLLDSDGRVVGVTTFLFKGGQNLNFAVPASHVARLLLRTERALPWIPLPLVRHPVADGHLQRGIVSANDGNVDQAIKEFDEAIRLDPKGSEAYRERANAWWRKTTQDFSTTRYFDNTIRDFDEAIHLDPNDIEAYSGRGWAYYVIRKYDDAIRDFNQAIRLDPKSSTDYCNRGRAWDSKSEYDNAIRDFDEAIRLDSKYVEAHRSRAWAWRSKKEYSKAINDFEEAIQLDPKGFPSMASRDLAWLLSTCPDGTVRDGKRAIRVATKACERGTFPLMLDTLAAAYAEDGQFVEAVRYQTKAIEGSSATSLGNRSEFRQRLELYKLNKPYRDFR